MGIRIFKSIDNTQPEYIARVWEDDFPTILFHFLGSSELEVKLNASIFWEKEIAPKQEQRKQAVINRQLGRERKAKKLKKGDNDG